MEGMNGERERMRREMERKSGRTRERERMREKKDRERGSLKGLRL